ncbi:hypothetical protein FACS1894190_16600 [Spirochaetia bacterium]|nr:hypothetical protein FACS1894190_16600 [Spirochaetia bacterium]
MKREQKVLVGLLAAILAGALVLAGCENPAGPKGDKGDPGDAASNAQKEQLATYGFTFGNPVHNAIGRAPTYSPAIYANAKHFSALGPTDADTLTAAGLIQIGGGVAQGDTLTVVSLSGKKSVRFSLTEATPTWGGFVTEFNRAITKGGLDAGIVASLVPYTDTSLNVAGINKHYVLKIAVPAAVAVADDFTIVVETGGSILSSIFGADPTFEIDIGVGAGYYDILTPGVLIAGIKDKWTVPILTSKDSDRTSASSTISLGTRSFDVPQQTTFGTTFAAPIAALFDEDLPPLPATQKPGAVAGYDVEALGVTATFADNIYSSGGLVFEAAKAGVSAHTGNDFVPAIGNYSKVDIDPSIGWGISAVHTTTGAAPVGTAEVTTQAVFAQTLAQSGATGVAADGERIIISYNGYTDTTVLSARTASALPDGDLINTLLTNVVLSVPGSGVLTATVTPGGDGYKAGETISVTDETSATLGFFGTPGTAAVTGTGGGTAASADYKAAAPDTWTVTVIGGGGAGDLIPTLPSKVTITPTVGGAARTPVIVLVDSGTPPITKIHAGATTSALVINAAYTQNAVDGKTFTYTAAPGVVTPANALTALSVVPATQY